MSNQGKKIIFRRMLSSYLSSVISITLVLVLFGLLGIIAVNVKLVTDYLKENIKISVIMNDDVTAKEARKIQMDVDSKIYTKKSEFISKEQGAQEMKELLGEDFMSVFENNPIPFSIDLYLKADYFAQDSIAKIRAEISNSSGVREIVYQESLVKAISGNMKKAFVSLLSVIALLSFVSLVLINNTVRLNIFAKKETIRTMKMVGAKRSYIRGPFVVRGFYQGLVSGLAATLVLGAGLFYAKREYPEIFAIVKNEYLIAVLAVVLLTGVALCVISTWRVLNKLISSPSDELYY